MTVAVKNKKPIVVSAAALRQAGFKSGQELEVRVFGGAIAILPKAPAADDEVSAAEQLSVDRGIAQSEKEYQEGKVAGPFATVEEFLADLHAESAKLGT